MTLEFVRRIAILAIIVWSTAMLTAWLWFIRPPEVYADSLWQSKKGEANLYRVSIRVIASPVAFVIATVKTNGKIVGVEPSSLFHTSGLGTGLIRRAILPAIAPSIFEPTRTLNLEIMIEIIGELHCTVAIDTLIGSARVEL